MRRKRDRVNGPYHEPARKSPNKWRVRLIIDGKTSNHFFETESAARAFATEARSELGHGREADALIAEAERYEQRAESLRTQAEKLRGRGMTVEEAVAHYIDYRRKRGNKPRTIATLRYRLDIVPRGLLVNVTPRRARAAYDAYQEGRAAATHQKSLEQAISFSKWCIAQGWIRRNPFDGIEKVGRVNKGKPQPRIDEARRLEAVAFEIASGDHKRNARRALAVLVMLYLDLRASELLAIVPRDIDDGGAILWIPDSKTDAGRRRLEIPRRLRALLYNAAQRTSERLFPFYVNWPRNQVVWLCKRAGVPQTCAHGLRGLHATLAVEAGATSEDVARALGHTSTSITEAHYIQRGATQRARQRRVERVLRGSPEMGEGADVAVPVPEPKPQPIENIEDYDPDMQLG